MITTNSSEAEIEYKWRKIKEKRKESELSTLQIRIGPNQTDSNKDIIYL